MIELFLPMYNMFGYLHVKSKEYEKSGYFPATPRIYQPLKLQSSANFIKYYVKAFSHIKATECKCKK